MKEWKSHEKEKDEEKIKSKVLRIIWLVFWDEKERSFFRLLFGVQ